MPRARLPLNGALLVCLGLLGAVLAAYATSLGNAPVWDDRPLVVDNPSLGTLAGIGRIWSTDLWSASAQGDPSSYYRPFTMLTFWVNVALGGRSPVSLRLGNVLIHATNVILLWLYARNAPGTSARSAGLMAPLFAVAPVCSEPVLWISGRFDLLVVTFALLALLASRKDGKVGTALALGAVAAGLLCKESFVAWVPMLLVHDLLVRRVAARSLLPKYVGVAAIGIAYLALRALLGIPSVEVLKGMSVRSFGQSFLFLVGSFLRELVWPTTLDPFRPYEVPEGGALLATFAALAALVVAPVASLRRRPENERARVAVFGVAWFVLTTLPSVVVGPTLAMVGDRYAYLPLVGLFIAIAALVSELGERYVLGWRIGAALGASVAVAGAVFTAVHARDWRSDRALAASSLRSDPENPYALYWLGSEAAQHEHLDKADELLARSLARNPGSWRTWNAVCYLRLHQVRLDEAEAACHRSIELQPKNPRAWLNLASVYVRAERWKQALPAAERALALSPSMVEAHYLAGVSAANVGLYDVAEAHVRDGLAVEPTHARLLAFESDLQRYRSDRPTLPVP
jgi:hypothetical protein